MGMPFFGRSRTGKNGDLPLPFSPHEPIQAEYRGRYYSGQVQSCKAGGFWVAWTSVDRTAPRPGKAETITLFSSRGSEGEGFQAVVTENTDTGLSLLKIVAKVELRGVHRRRYVRIPYQFPVHFRNLNGASPARKVDTHTHDLSGGGVRVYVNKWDLPSPGDRLDLELEIPACALIRTKAEVSWTGRAGSSAVLYEMGLRFLDIREKDRELIFRRVFDRQVELHRSGLI
jgi:hypothetical protein